MKIVVGPLHHRFSLKNSVEVGTSRLPFSAVHIIMCELNPHEELLITLCPPT